MLLRIYVGYGGTTPQETETRDIKVNELGTELMFMFLEHDRVPMIILFKKGEKNSECVIVVRKQERRT